MIVIRATMNMTRNSASIQSGMATPANSLKTI